MDNLTSVRQPCVHTGLLLLSVPWMVTRVNIGYVFLPSSHTHTLKAVLGANNFFDRHLAAASKLSLSSIPSDQT